MRTAAEALRLPHAQLLHREEDEVREALKAIDAMLDKEMAYFGLFPFNVMVTRELPTRGIKTAGFFYLSSDSAAKALRVTLDRRGWDVAIQLMSTPPAIEGGPLIPHHWVLQITPKLSEYPNPMLATLAEVH